MENVKQYLTEYIDDNAEISSCRQEIAEGLPLLLKASFDYYELTIMNESALILKPVQKQTVYRLQNWMKRIEEISGMNTVLLMEEATPYMIKKMLREKIAFIIPGRQISLPFLIMAIKTEKKREYKSIMKFSPIVQLIFLFVLYSENDRFSIEETSSALEISKMSAQRGLTDLERIGLLSHKIEGKTGRKKVFERISQKDFYADGKVYLDNPLKSTVYVRDVPKISKCVKSGVSALAEQTMLGEPEQKTYALWSKYKEQLEGCIVNEEQALEERLPAVQLMKYDVEKLSGSCFIDPISLMLSLPENDERIEMSIDELMGNYDWYECRREEW